jgi:hypothetical protein
LFAPCDKYPNREFNRKGNLFLNWLWFIDKQFYRFLNIYILKYVIC